MDTVDLLKSLYPPVSYDVSAPFISAHIAAEAAVLDAVTQAVAALLLEVFPDTTQAGLSDWERVYGLPDKCLKNQVVSEGLRRDFLLAKINDTGGIRNEDYIARVKRALGLGVTVTEFGAMTCEDACDSALFDEDWRYVWQVNLRQGLDVWQMSCEDACDSQLDWFDNDALMCVLKTHAPAGTLPIVAYE